MLNWQRHYDSLWCLKTSSTFKIMHYFSSITSKAAGHDHHDTHRANCLAAEPEKYVHDPEEVDVPDRAHVTTESEEIDEPDHLTVEPEKEVDRTDINIEPSN